MITSRRKKAVAGITSWILLTLAFIAILVRRNHVTDPGPLLSGAMIMFVLVGQFMSFFWGCYNLAEGKGYSGALALISLFGPLGQIGILTALLWWPDRNSHSRPADARVRKKHSKPRESPIARKVRYRRNALLGNSFGLTGILIALTLFIFPMGISPDNEFLAAVVVFILGYSSVLVGCRFWVLAKGWPDAVVFIGLMPFAALFIPYVRLLILLNPLFPLAIVMAPITLIVVVLVLPDKSGLP